MSTCHYHSQECAGGCFWGLQLAFDRVPGVVNSTVGYTGGNDPNPNYNSVCRGRTGHAEAVQVAHPSFGSDICHHGLPTWSQCSCELLHNFRLEAFTAPNTLSTTSRIHQGFGLQDRNKDGDCTKIILHNAIPPLSKRLQSRMVLIVACDQ